MTKKVPVIMFLFIMLLYSKVVFAEGLKYVEIFDPKQNKVVKVIQLNTEIHNVVASWIKNINGIYGKSNPITDDGYAIKIPIDPAVYVHSKSLNAIVNEVYIIIPEEDPPFFMIFENESKLCCFPFNGNIDTLSEILKFNLKANR
jgi:hypothetical protein